MLYLRLHDVFVYYPSSIHNKLKAANVYPMKHILRSTLLLTIFLGVDKALGLVRQFIIARQFGLSSQLDSFNAANNLPDLLYALISGGALAIAFIPVLSQYLEESGRPAAWDLFSRITNLAFLVTAVISALVALLAGPLVRWELGIAPGFSIDQQKLVVELMRLDLIGTLIFSISGLIMAGLQANQHFLLPAMAPALYNLGQIFGALVLAPHTGFRLGPVTLPAFGLGIYGLVYGVILGAILHLTIQIPGLFHFKFRWTPAINLHNPGVIQVLNLMGPRLLTMFLIQMIFMARDNMASRLEAGAVSALTYGWFIMQVPETLIGTALATVLLPTLSEQIARGEREKYRQTLNHSLRVILALTIPSAVLLSVALRPLVGLLGFDAQGIEMVTWATRAYLVGLIGQSLLEVVARAFYAQQDARTPLYASLFRILAYAGLGAVFLRPMGAAGIALADSLAVTVEVLALLYLLNRQMPGLVRVGNTLTRVTAITVAIGATVYALMRFVPLPDLPLAVTALALGGLAVLPFIRQEVRLLIKL
jgi:putative peptidoglycan lipid II flippase